MSECTRSDTAMAVMLKLHISEFKQIKRNNEDLGNIEFNKSYALSVNPPKYWPMYDILGDVLSHAADLAFTSIIVIYPSTDAYSKISKAVVLSAQDKTVNVDYFSWHEMYSAMNRVQQDVSHMRRLKEMLSNADLVVFVGAASAMQVVIDQVVGSTSGCLILLG